MNSEFYELLVSSSLAKITPIQSIDINSDVVTDLEVYSLYLILNSMQQSELQSFLTSLKNVYVKKLIQEILLYKKFEELKARYSMIFSITKKGSSKKKIDIELTQIRQDTKYLEFIDEGLQFIKENDYPLIASKAVILVLSAVSDLNNCFLILNETIKVYRNNDLIRNYLFDIRIELLFTNGLKRELFYELLQRKSKVENLLYKLVYRYTVDPGNTGFFYFISSFIFFIFFPKSLLILLCLSVLIHFILFSISYKYSNLLLQNLFIHKGLYVSACIILGYIISLILYIGK